MHALEEIMRLQGYINDLVGIHALAALWAGRDEHQIVSTLLEGIIGVLGLEFACARLNIAGGGAAIEIVRLAPARNPTGLAANSEQIRRLTEWFKGCVPQEPGEISDPTGPGKIHIATMHLGPQNDLGRIVLSARRAGFPCELDMILLRVAANQAVIGLQEARVRKRAEERLRRSEARLAEGQRLSRTGSWGWNVASGELVFTEEMFRIFGLDPDQQAPTFAEAIERIHEDDRSSIERLLAAAVREKKDYEFETRLALPGGTIRHVQCIGRPFINEAGGLEYVGTLLDITQRKKTEQSLRTAEAQLAHVARVTMMGELTGSIAHEVKQPLAAILANGSAGLHWLAAEEPNLEETRAALTRIVKEANRASEVADRIRAFLQRREPNRATVAVNDLIHEVLALTQYLVIKDGVSLRTELAVDLHHTRGDSVQLQQVMVNLIVNAIEAMNVAVGGRRELFVRSRNEEPGQIAVSVRDSGVGIDPDRAEELFKPFVTSKTGGMGMGLPISRTIIEAHGGKLLARPNMDQGATFEFTLPGETAAGRGLESVPAHVTPEAGSGRSENR